MARKKRNLIYSNARKVTSENITINHIQKILLELYDICETFEDKDSLELARKARKLAKMMLHATNLFEHRIKHEFNNLEYLQRRNRERQAEMTDAQLAALYKKRAEEMVKETGLPVTDDLVDIQISHMIKAYREREGDRLQYNRQIKDEIEKKIENFKPEELDFNDETLF